MAADGMEINIPESRVLIIITGKENPFQADIGTPRPLKGYGGLSHVTKVGINLDAKFSFRKRHNSKRESELIICEQAAQYV
jgi:hypothetical protein